MSKVNLMKARRDKYEQIKRLVKMYYAIYDKGSEHLAYKVDVGQSSIYKYMNNPQNMRLKNLVALVEELNIPQNELFDACFTGEGIPNTR